MDVIISANGDLRFIYNDDLAGLLDAGESKIARASHVEPAIGGGWSADMSPVDGPVIGPFKTRAEALAAEVAWLQQNRGL